MSSDLMLCGVALLAEDESDQFRIRPRIFCNDGFSLSVQAGKYHYCTPRDNYGPYTAVEVGFPSGPVPATWQDYSDGDNVYGYVPIEMVAELIVSHGGVARLE